MGSTVDKFINFMKLDNKDEEDGEADGNRLEDVRGIAVRGEAPISGA